MIVTAVLAGCASGTAPGQPDAGAESDAAGPPADAGGARAAKRAVVLVIGDGMGQGQLEAASRYAHGAPDQLVMQALQHRGQIRTASLSGITDSAAAATTMATGVATYNGRIGLDRAGAPAETLVELAHRLGAPAGVVTTAAIPHATPGGFTAHRPSREDYVDIADDQVQTVRPDVMLGGGAMYFLPAGVGSSVRDDAGLLDAAAAAGYSVVTTATELAAVAGDGARVLGLFADEHMDYVIDRAVDTEQPTLSAMSIAALDSLDRLGDEVFFLMIEGARIDMASHGNDVERAIAETIALDETIAAVRAWGASREVDMTLIVTADHECGGLRIDAPAPAGELPQVSWRWDQHTNAQVAAFAEGPGTEVLDGEIRDHRWVHAVLASRLTGEALVAPPPLIVPDGTLGDLRYRAAEQTVASGFGEGFNELDALYVDADAHGLAIGIEGLFQWDENAVVIALDVDYGAGTGPSDLSDAVTDTDGRADAILASLNVVAPPVIGFGVELAVVVWGGADPHLEDMHEDAGLRGIVAPLGDPTDLWWYGAATNFGPGVRVSADASTPVAGDGLEVVVPWDTIYPDGVPAGATIAIAAVLVNDDGGYTSNQALPPFSSGISNPGRALTPLPGVVVFNVDSDADGVPDGDASPFVAP